MYGHPHGRSSSSSDSSSKSGKGSKSKGGKCGKSGGWCSSSSSSSSSPDWQAIWHVHPHPHDDWTSESEDYYYYAPDPPDGSAPGICAPTPDRGGLECDRDDDWAFCTSPGERSECGAGRTCYPKDLCPRFGGKDHAGVCGTTDPDGKPGGLECDEVTTYCTKPGGHAECGRGRTCFDAGLCYGGDRAGVCGMAPHHGHGGGLDCDEVTTGCTDPGGTAECAYGATCFEASLCGGGDPYAGFCGDPYDDGHGCDAHTTLCKRPGEGGQCPKDKECLDVRACDPKPPPTEKPTPEPTPAPSPGPTELGLREVCFVEGTIVDCDVWLADGRGGDAWGGDGEGGGKDDDDDGTDDGDKDDGKEDDGSKDDDGYGSSGGGFVTRFTYTMDTDGKVDPDDVVAPLETVILDDVAEYVDGNDNFSSFTGKISAKPEDYIAGECVAKKGGFPSSATNGAILFNSMC